MSSWLKLYRKLAETDLWLAEPFTKGQAWADLLMLARFQDGFVRIRGIKVEVKRGQVAWSEVELAKRWQWSRGKVRRFLGEMEMEQQIEQQKNNITTLISIVNFERYQGNGTTDSTANRTADGTADGTAEPPQPKTGGDHGSPKNGKNGKNDKTFSLDSIEYRLANYLFNHIRRNNSNAKTPNLQTWAKNIELMIRNDKRKPDEIKAVIEWCQKDSFWYANILSTKKLREKYDQLVLKMGGAKVQNPLVDFDPDEEKRKLDEVCS